MNNKIDNDNTKKAMFLNVMTGVISIIVSLLTTLFITRIMSTDDLGIATSFISLRSILTIICVLSIQTAINRMLIDVNEKNEYKYLSSIYIISSLSCILFFIIYLIFSKYLNVLFGFNTPLMIFMFSMMFFGNGIVIVSNYWFFKNKYIYSTIYNLLSVPIAQILSLILVYFMSEYKYLGRLIGLSIFDIILGLICGFVILRKGKLTFDKKYTIDSLHICIPMIPHLLSQILLAGCDLIMIKNLVDASSAGIYSMAYTISNIIYTILLKIMISWSPWVYRQIKENQINVIYNASNYIISISFYLCLGLITIAPEMVKIFLPSEYSPVSNIIYPICIGIFFQIMYVFFYDIEYYHKKNNQIALFSLLAALLNIILNAICIPKFGYIVASYTTLVGYLFLSIIHYIGMKRVDNRNFYNIKYFIYLSLFLMCEMVILILSNNNIFVRYIILILITLYYLIKYKNDIIIFLDKKRRIIE